MKPRSPLFPIPFPPLTRDEARALEAAIVAALPEALRTHARVRVGDATSPNGVTFDVTLLAGFPPETREVRLPERLAMIPKEVAVHAVELLVEEMSEWLKGQRA